MMSKKVLNRVSVPGRAFDLLWTDDEFYREVVGSKKVSSSGKFPRCDQWCDDSGFHMAFALAGYASSDVDVSVQGNMLCISGKGTNRDGSEDRHSSYDSSTADSDDYPAKSPSPNVQQGIILRGIARRSFKVKYFIHPSFDIANTGASMRDGLLEIYIPRGDDNVIAPIEIKEK